MKTTDFKYCVNHEDAHKVADWIKNRGGIIRWPSQDLGDLGRSWTTPATNDDGSDRTDAPHWKAPRPGDKITDITSVGVCVDKEVKRFHVAVRRSSNGLSLKVTDAGSRRIREEVAKAGEGAYYEFDRINQEAVIMAPVKVVSLPEWLSENPEGGGQ